MINLNSLEDFVRFIFLHMACVDGSLHPNERETIIEKMTELFPDQPLHNEKLSEAEAAYKKAGFSAAEELITEHWHKYSSVDEGIKQKLYANLFDIINSDARVNEEETRVLRMYKTWLLA